MVTGVEPVGRPPPVWTMNEHQEKASGNEVPADGAPHDAVLDAVTVVLSNPTTAANRYGIVEEVCTVTEFPVTVCVAVAVWVPTFPASRLLAVEAGLPQLPRPQSTAIASAAASEAFWSWRRST